MDMNSECSGNFVFANFHEFVYKNFVFVCKTSNLFIRICESFQHVMLKTACTVIVACHLFLAQMLNIILLILIVTCLNCS